jgi:hypothetical protein
MILFIIDEVHLEPIYKIRIFDSQRHVAEVIDVYPVQMLLLHPWSTIYRD